MTNKKLLPTYQKMFDLLSDESKWTKNVPARDKKGKPCSPNSHIAVSWCLVGASFKVSNYYARTLNIDMYLVLKRSSATFNDDPKTSFKDVKTFLAQRIFDLSGYRSWSFMGYNFQRP